MGPVNESFFNDEELRGVLERFETMLEKKEKYFFDVHEFEDIIDHYLDNSNYRNALEAVKIASLQHPRSTTILLKKAQVYLQKGQASLCMRVLGELENLEAGNHEIYLMKGTALVMMNRAEEAIAQFDRAVSLSGEERGELLHQVYHTLDHLGQYNMALRFLKVAYKEDNNNKNLVYDLAYGYEKTDNLKESAHYYEKYIELDPFSESAWYNLGLVYNRLEQFDKALEAYDFAIAINESYASAYFNKANTLANSGQFLEAIPVYIEYIEMEDDNESAFCYLAECYEKTGRFDDALKNYRRALKLDAHYPDAWCGIGIVYMLQEKLFESLYYLKKAARLDDSNPESWFYLAEVNEKLGFFEDALEPYRKTTLLDPSDVDAWLGLAEMLMKTNNLHEAHQALQEGYEYNPGDAQLKCRLAGLLLNMGDFERALYFAEAGISEDFDAHIEIMHYFPLARDLREVKQLLDKYRP